MIRSVVIERETGNGKHSDVLDVCEALAAGDYGSAANAACVMIRQSPLFQEAIAKLEPAAKRKRQAG
jgi:hypothetical protein